ncbi:MAG: C25 family cysteine peptidase [Caldilineaceae bacterium]
MIVSHADFLDAISPLAAYRRTTGYRTKVVDVQAIYDAFN